ncbi:hypothetical protein D1872_191990 [compost metagenome]
MRSDNEQFIRYVRDIVYTVLNDEKLSRGEWRVGKVKSVTSPYSLSVYIDGSEVPQTVPCNPDVVFNTGDEVWVHFVNRDSKNKFVPYKRGV